MCRSLTAWFLLSLAVPPNDFILIGPKSGLNFFCSSSLVFFSSIKKFSVYPIWKQTHDGVKGRRERAAWFQEGTAAGRIMWTAWELFGTLLRGQGRPRDLPLATGCSIPPAHTAAAESLPHLRFIPMPIWTQRREGWERGRLSTSPLEMRKGEQPTIIKRIKAHVLLTYNHAMTIERHPSFLPLPGQ